MHTDLHGKSLKIHVRNSQRFEAYGGEISMFIARLTRSRYNSPSLEGKYLEHTNARTALSFLTGSVTPVPSLEETG